MAGDDKDRIEHAKEIEKYAEYALSATALTSSDSKTVMELTETLEQENPKSEYLTQVLSKYGAAARQAGHPEKAIALAEKVAKSDPSNAEALLVVAEANLQKRPAVASDYASRAAGILSKKKGEEALLGNANYIAGVAYGAQSKWPQANQSLQAALPSIKGNQQAMGYALFYLGMANYNLGKMTLNKAQMKQALNYFEQCAAVPGPMQGQASNNVSAIRQELR
jgi:tetratricopeptide (TPR) repeat protein